MTTVRNAAEVSAHLQQALARLNRAQKELKVAIELAEADYPHLDTAMKQASGALSLVQSAVATDVSNWNGYLVARRQS